MPTIHLYLAIHSFSDESNWGHNITATLEGIQGIERVMVIGQGDGNYLQINLDLDISLARIESIEQSIVSVGGKIVSADVHFPHDLTGISDAYGASAVSLPLTNEINKVKGVIGSSVSSSGVIKVELASEIADKDSIIQQILEIITERRTKS